MFLKGLILSSVHRSLYFSLVVFVLGLCLLHPLTSQSTGLSANMVPKANASETEEEAKIPEGLSPDEVDEYLSGLSDK
jgi:hypothetical protein